MVGERKSIMCDHDRGLELVDPMSKDVVLSLDGEVFDCMSQTEGIKAVGCLL